MKIPFIDLQAQYQAYKTEIDEAIQNVLNTSQYIMGPEVKKLEDGLATILVQNMLLLVVVERMLY